jgi:hypothetical protein
MSAYCIRNCLSATRESCPPSSGLNIYIIIYLPMFSTIYIFFRSTIIMLNYLKCFMFRDCCSYLVLRGTCWDRDASKRGGRMEDEGEKEDGNGG